MHTHACFLIVPVSVQDSQKIFDNPIFLNPIPTGYLTPEEQVNKEIFVSFSSVLLKNYVMVTISGNKSYWFS